MMWVVLIVVLVVTGILAFWVLSQYLHRPPRDVVVRCNCPRCRQKIGYRTSQIGHKAMCSRCGQRFFFPVPSPPKADGEDDDD